MYSQGIYTAFVQLRKQYYKIKTRDSIDRYTMIETYRKEYITFRRFCDRIDEYNVYQPYENMYDVQDIFDKMIDQSQNNTLKYYIF